MRILTDLDGTLLKGSLVLGHAIYLHDKKVIDLGDLPKAWDNDKKNESLIYELAISYQMAIGGHHIDDLLIDGYLDTIKKSDYTSVLDRMINAYTTIITGSADFLITPLVLRLQAMGFNVDCIGTSYEMIAKVITGKITRPAYTGKEKLIEQYCSGEVFDYGFGDTLSDLPILERSINKVLVNPTITTLKAINLPNVEIIIN